MSEGISMENERNAETKKPISHRRKERALVT